MGSGSFSKGMLGKRSVASRRPTISILLFLISLLIHNRLGASSTDRGVWSCAAPMAEPASRSFCRDLRTIHTTPLAAVLQPTRVRPNLCNNVSTAQRPGCCPPTSTTSSIASTTVCSSNTSGSQDGVTSTPILSGLIGCIAPATTTTTPIIHPPFQQPLHYPLSLTPTPVHLPLPLPSTLPHSLLSLPTHPGTAHAVRAPDPFTTDSQVEGRVETSKSTGSIVSSDLTPSGGDTAELDGKTLRPPLMTSTKPVGVEDKIVRRHTTASYRPGQCNYRIQKEMNSFLRAPPPHCRLHLHPSNIRIWIVEIAGPPDSAYAGETYHLHLRFPSNYPLSPPSAVFLPPHVPRHPHVYSNGDICLNLLGADWRPTLTARAVAVAIMSMLSSAKRKVLPVDNAAHADMPAGSSQTSFMYHDDKC